MTDLIKEAQELCEAATPGPWKDVTHSKNYGEGYGATTYYVQMGNDLLQIGLGENAEDCCRYYHLAKFIARARTLVPELIEQIEAIGKDCDEWKERAEEAERELAIFKRASKGQCLLCINAVLSEFHRNCVQYCKLGGCQNNSGWQFDYERFSKTGGAGNAEAHNKSLPQKQKI